MTPMELSASALARALNVSTPTVNEIARERRGITADMALRLARCLGTTAEFWVNLQASYELRVAEVENGEAISLQITPLVACA